MPLALAIISWLCMAPGCFAAQYLRKPKFIVWDKPAQEGVDGGISWVVIAQFRLPSVVKRGKNKTFTVKIPNFLPFTDFQVNPPPPPPPPPTRHSNNTCHFRLYLDMRLPKDARSKFNIEIDRHIEMFCKSKKRRPVNLAPLGYF
jgi:hypothetical protein